ALAELTRHRHEPFPGRLDLLERERLARVGQSAHAVLQLLVPVFAHALIHPAGHGVGHPTVPLKPAPCAETDLSATEFGHEILLWDRHFRNLLALGPPRRTCSRRRTRRSRGSGRSPCPIPAAAALIVLGLAGSAWR